MEQATEAPARSPAQRRRFVKPVLVAAALVALAALALLGYKGWRVYQTAEPLYADLQALRALAADEPDEAIAAAGPLLARAREQSLALRAEAGPLLLLTQHLGWVPVYGPDLVAAGPLLELENELIGAADDLFVALAHLAPALDAGFALDPALLAQLEAERPRLEQARAAAGRASERWASLPANLSPATRALISPVGALPPLLEAVASLAIAGGHAGPALAPLLPSASDAPLDPHSLVTQLAAARPQLEAAQQELARAQEALARAPEELRPSSAGSLLERLDTLLPQLRDGLELAIVVPPLLGSEGPRQYMLVAQSPDELRATGGFISSVGVLTIDGGRLQLSDLRDSAGLDDYRNQVYPYPPAPLMRYMNLEQWFFRDANWSPDFPTSARTMSELYALGTKRTLTNVIAFHPGFLELVLDVTGPLAVEGSTVPVSAQNVMQYMLAQYNQQWGKSSEAFIGPLSAALLDRIVHRSSGHDLLALGGALQRALDERHLLVAVTDPEAAALLARRGWDGAVRPGANDFLMVVDSNVGYDKVNSFIDQQVLYSADLSDLQAPAATIQITHTHRLSGTETCAELEVQRTSVKTYEAHMVSCYQNYLRVLTPAGSKLLASPGSPIPAAWTWHGVPASGKLSLQPREAGATVFGGFLAVPLGGTHETIASYALPPAVVTEQAGRLRYRLVVQKQPARGDVPYTIRVQLPAKATLIEAMPAPTARAGPILTFEVRRLAGDTIEVTFQRP